MNDELRRLQAEQIRMKREAAQRARRLAAQFSSAEDRDRAQAFAEEVDAQADELERAFSDDTGLQPAPQVVQTQVQVQQGPPLNDDDSEKKKP
jgi:hypothetical protein